MAAQRFEQPAIDKLCADFTPLINKEAHRQSVFNALGEDAVNIAWEIFLEFIHSYKGNNYRLLPGLIQKHLHYRLLDRLHQKAACLVVMPWMPTKTLLIRLPISMIILRKQIPD